MQGFRRVLLVRVQVLRVWVRVRVLKNRNCSRLSDSTTTRLQTNTQNADKICNNFPPWMRKQNYQFFYLSTLFNDVYCISLSSAFSIISSRHNIIATVSCHSGRQSVSSITLIIHPRSVRPTCKMIRLRNNLTLSQSGIRSSWQTDQAGKT